LTKLRLDQTCHPGAFAQLEAQAFERGWQESQFEERPDRIYTSLWQADHCLCYVYGRIITDEVELWRIAGHPERRRQGLGLRALNAFVAECRRRGGRNLFLEVSHHNQVAVIFYRNAGFTETGRRVGYYGPGDDALLMCLDLQTTPLTTL